MRVTGRKAPCSWQGSWQAGCKSLRPGPRESESQWAEEQEAGNPEERAGLPWGAVHPISSGLGGV